MGHLIIATLFLTCAEADSASRIVEEPEKEDEDKTRLLPASVGVLNEGVLIGGHSRVKRVLVKALPGTRSGIKNKISRHIFVASFAYEPCSFRGGLVEFLCLICLFDAPLEMISWCERKE